MKASTRPRPANAKSDSMNWFAVDKAGLAALTERRDKSFVLAELLSNAWDAPGTTRVEVTTLRIPGRPEVEIRVVDDSPAGFTDLAHAFTLFAHTNKRAEAEQRGRFNLGEKLSLAIARSGRITSTGGTLTFDKAGRKQSRTPRTAAGSDVCLRIPMTGAELDAAIEQAMTFIAPVPTSINGRLLAERTPLATISARLPTELQGEDGAMRRTERQTQLVLYAPATGEGRLYELGVPVCSTGDTFDIDVRQKVPLSLERESVTDTYLRRVRASVLGQAAHLIDADAAKSSWISQALEARDLPDAAVAAVIEQRYGKDVVIYDPSDPEANKLAASKGYAVVHGGAFSAAAWHSIRNAGAMRPAGQVTPSPKPWAEHGAAAQPIEPTPAMRRFALWCIRLGVELLETKIQVEFYQRFNDPMAAAAYGGGCLQFSVQRLGRAWFDGPVTEAHIDLLLHEFGHHYESDHLSRKYYQALTKLGARLAVSVRASPEILRLDAG